MRKITLIGLILLSSLADAQIAEWYKRDIVNTIQKAKGIIIYKVKSVALHSVNGPYIQYKIDTDTVEELKGSAPKGKCYFLYTQGEWNTPHNIGETHIVILNTKYTGECGTIEPGLGAPATADNVALFEDSMRPIEEYTRVVPNR